MKIRTKIKFFLLICFITSITHQFEDFGLFKPFNDKKHNKTEDNNSTHFMTCSNSTNSTDENFISQEEPSKK